MLKDNKEIGKEKKNGRETSQTEPKRRKYNEDHGVFFLSKEIIHFIFTQISVDFFL